jgi:hypothetical protein
MPVTDQALGGAKNQRFPEARRTGRRFASVEIE